MAEPATIPSEHADLHAPDCEDIKLALQTFEDKQANREGRVIKHKFDYGSQNIKKRFEASAPTRSSFFWSKCAKTTADNVQDISATSTSSHNSKRNAEFDPQFEPKACPHWEHYQSKRAEANLVYVVCVFWCFARTSLDLGFSSSLGIYIYTLQFKSAAQKEDKRAYDIITKQSLKKRLKSNWKGQLCFVMSRRDCPQAVYQR